MTRSQQYEQLRQANQGRYVTEPSGLNGFACVIRTDGRLPIYRATKEQAEVLTKALQSAFEDGLYAGFKGAIK